MLPEVGGVEGVQICVLLSTFYLYHDRPNLAFAIHGMGVKCAHAMYLHQEATWKEPTALTREVKRRVWWALYVVDCFYSIIFGRPRSVRDEESNVAMVRNLEDTATRHPAFNSTENVSGSSFPVTIFSYQRYKFRLYTIAARVMRDIYFGNSSTPLTSVSQTIQSISRDLESWFQSLPPELKHSSGSDSNLPDEFMQETWNDILPTASFDYSEGISSVRQVFSQTAHPQVTRPGWTDYPVNPSLLTESAEPEGNIARPFRFSPPGNGFQGVGQAWLWDDGPLQPVNMESGENSTF
ncbi:hypothetical protein HZS61_010431 [Fusarium oxysporum f. sp. conglutinans]|uniref:Xylanolytic transcriptional activator regulatory domain-containing protein n=1 Tax=Fusarium oxysporum f. sp. conglutinans TaxID=100902 RepID=A0A8H6LNF4_FUSOX|nr:hypothetical protein HZS61_010431 [Fusarium oxysporum f. sp. conglutinans]